MCASLSYTCMPWYSPGIWYYNRLILLLLKLGIVVIMILVIRWLIVILLYYFLVPFYSYYFLIQYIFMVYYGMLTWYSYAPFLFLHTHGEFWLPEFAHPGIWVLHLLSRYLRRSCASEEYGVCFARLPEYLVQFMSPFSFCWLSLILYYLDSIFILWIYYRIMLSLCRNYILHCSDFIVFIINLYNLFRSL